MALKGKTQMGLVLSTPPRVRTLKPALSCKPTVIYRCKMDGRRTYPQGRVPARYKRLLTYKALECVEANTRSVPLTTINIAVHLPPRIITAYERVRLHKLATSWDI